MASSSSSSFNLRKTFPLILLITLSSILNFFHATAHYTTIISFGDSLADTGNLLHLMHSNIPPHFASPPYGETFFHHPTGRSSDGRLIIDFIAEYLGFPLVSPYIGGKTANSTSVGWGVNFAVAGATALDDAFFKERRIGITFFNTSLGVQLRWFKESLRTLCQTPSSCKKLLGTALVLMGEIGGNDYNHALLSGSSIEEVHSFVSPVVDSIASAVNELIELGAVTIMVPGNLPIGCSSAYLTFFKSTDEKQYDPNTGCIIWLNMFAEYHNEVLQRKLDQIRELHPHAIIIYADYYNAAMRFYRSPNQYGFSRGALVACCGAGGPYNYNSSEICGYPPAAGCDDPSLYVAWDGLHLTEAAYRMIAKGLLEGPYTIPSFHASLISMTARPPDINPN